MLERHGQIINPAWVIAQPPPPTAPPTAPIAQPPPPTAPIAPISPPIAPPIAPPPPPIAPSTAPIAPPIAPPKMMLVPYAEAIKNSVQTLSIDTLLQAIPRGYRNKAKALLNYVKDKLSWNAMGEITWNGETFGGTHIADLIRYAIREYGKAPPEGFTTFKNLLEKLNVPRSLVTQYKNSFSNNVGVIRKKRGWLRI